MKRREIEKTGGDNSALVASRFRGFKPEDEKHVRNEQVQTESTLKRLLVAWYSFQAQMPSNDLNRAYSLAIKSMGDIRATSQDLEEFLGHIRQISKGKPVADELSDEVVALGLFISAIVNTGKENAYTIDLHGLPVPELLGYMNSKSLMVLGDTGDACAMENSGEIVVLGDVHGSFAHMQRSGTSVLVGDCEDVGTMLEGGKVILYGSIKLSFCREEDRHNFDKEMFYAVGRASKGGEILLARLKSYQVDPEFTGCRIFVKNTLVFDKKWVGPFRNEERRGELLEELSRNEGFLE